MEVLNGNYTPDVVYCNRRNVVEKVTIGGVPFVVKRYKRPIFVNKVVYSFFRKSKCRRAYEYALRLLQNGVETPFPAAYFECYKNGLFDYGVFISEYVPYKLFESVYDATVTETERQEIIHAFVSFLVSVHKKGILPMDLNAGNVFYYKDADSGCYKFALTDINRMKFAASPTIRDVALSLEQCFIEIDRLMDLAHAYSNITGTSMVNILHHILCCRIKRERKWAAKSKIRKRKS